MATTDFEYFVKPIGLFDPNVDTILFLQMYIPCTAQMTGKRQEATTLEKLEEFSSNNAAAVKVLEKEVKLETKMTSHACAEGAQIFMELFNFFETTKVQGHNGIVNPNELFTMRWYFTTVVRALLKRTDPRIDLLVPILRGLVIRW